MYVILFIPHDNNNNNYDTNWLTALSLLQALLGILFTLNNLISTIKLWGRHRFYKNENKAQRR